ncbi:MAG: hypothetical protein WBK91_02195 [Alphaproteobacteria bacterium]
MKTLLRLVVILSLLLNSGCGITFVPYDYKQQKPAKLKTKNYNFRWQNQKLKIEKNF